MSMPKSAVIADLAVFIGRFQFPHNSHVQIIRRALEQARHVLVLVGSSNVTRSPKNPFTYQERKVMLESCFPGAALTIRPLRDFPYQEDRWLAEVQATVAAVASELKAQTVRITGHFKDDSSYYLERFPQWGPVLAQPNFEGRSATELRDLFLSPEAGSDLVLRSAVPEPVLDFLHQFQRLPQYQALQRESAFLKQYRQQWANSPYPPTFVTVDSVVVHTGHLLVVERRAEPGRGLLALPGGFLGQGERLLDSAIRELREETRLKIPEKVLRGSLRGSQVFDHPDRSQRGRTITHAFYFEFPEGPLPKVKGGDDAAQAFWLPLADFYALDGQMYEDHWHIVNRMLT